MALNHPRIHEDEAVTVDAETDCSNYYGTKALMDDLTTGLADLHATVCRLTLSPAQLSSSPEVGCLKNSGGILADKSTV